MRLIDRSGESSALGGALSRRLMLASNGQRSISLNWSLLASTQDGEETLSAVACLEPASDLSLREGDQLSAIRQSLCPFQGLDLSARN